MIIIITKDIYECLYSEFEYYIKKLEKSSLNLIDIELLYTLASLNFFEKLRLTQVCLKLFCKTVDNLVIFS